MPEPRREEPPALADCSEVLNGLLAVAADLCATPDRRQALGRMLQEARRLARAEAGSLYVLKDGVLRFVVAQNDRLGHPQVEGHLLHREMPASPDCLAGYVASTGRTVSIADADALDERAPFSVNRSFDQATGYRTKSILAVPLKCPDGHCLGVLQLLNRIGPDGGVEPFPEPESGALVSLASMAAIAVQNILLQEQVRRAHLDTIMRLSIAVEVRDNETAEHVRRISQTSALIARALGVPEREVDLIACASPMHDIGKIGIPDVILRKPARLTPEERLVMQQHTVIGADILSQSESDVIALARDIALTHHERWDGTGYPFGLAGEMIPLAGRIVGVADVFDALIHDRCYKVAYSLELSLDLMRRQEGRQFDAVVLRAFLLALDDILRAQHVAPAAASPRGAGEVTCRRKPPTPDPAG